MTHWNSRCLQRWLFAIKGCPFCSRFWTRSNPRMTPGQRMLHHIFHESMGLLFPMVLQWIGQALENTGHFGHEKKVPIFCYFRLVSINAKICQGPLAIEILTLPMIDSALEPASMTLPEMSCSRSSSLALPCTRWRCDALRSAFLGISRLVHALYGHGTNASRHIAHLWESVRKHGTRNDKNDIEGMQSN